MTTPPRVPFPPIAAPVGDDAVPPAQRLHSAQDDHHPKNWLGFAALGTGALALGPIAVILGHLGLVANARGEARNRAVALAGTILGYVAIAAAGILAAAYFFVFGPTVATDTNDVHAQADVAAVGREVALYWVEGVIPPTVVQGENEYRVENVTIPALLTTAHTLTMTGQSPTEWCVAIAYAGGSESAYSYVSSAGVVAGDQCPEPESTPSPEPTPEPSASATPAPTTDAAAGA